MTGTAVNLELTGAVAHLELTRPERLNALSAQIASDLHHHLDTIESTPGIGAVVISGQGRAFSAGADISEMDHLEDPADFGQWLSTLADALNRLSQLALPTIAAVDGLALGGGCELALACDLRIASPRSEFALPEVRLGLLPGAGGTQRLPRIVPPAIAAEMLLTGAPVSAARGGEIGLVNLVADDPVQAAKDLAAAIASRAPLAVRAVKRLVGVALNGELADGLAAERAEVLALFATADRVEGFRVFREGGEPVFRGA